MCSCFRVIGFNVQPCRSLKARHNSAFNGSNVKSISPSSSHSGERQRYADSILAVDGNHNELTLPSSFDGSRFAFVKQEQPDMIALQ